MAVVVMLAKSGMVGVNGNSVYLFLQQATCHHEEDNEQARPECSVPES